MKKNYEKLVKSLQRLKEQYKNYLSNKEERSELDKEGLKESVIRRFEFCNDNLWKHLNKYLQEKEKLVDIPNSPNGTFRTVYETNLIDEKMFERFMNYSSLRCMAAHDLDKMKTKASFNKISDFIQDANKICKMIT